MKYELVMRKAPEMMRMISQSVLKECKQSYYVQQIHSNSTETYGEGHKRAINWKYFS